MAQPVTAVKDWHGNEYPLMATINYDWELNGNQTIDATILCNRVNEKFIDDIAEKWSVIDHYGNEHKILILNRQGQGEKQYVKIKAIPVFLHALQNMRIYERVDKHMTAQEAFTRIFDGTGFTFVLVDSFDAVEWEGFGEGESLMDTFQRALERYGAEFRIIKNQVELRKLIGRDLQIQYRHRLNASNITLENDASAMWTYVKGYGDYGDGEGGEDWQDAKLVKEYTSPLAKIPGIGKLDAPPLKNGNIKTETKMMEELKRIVDESLKISVTADIHDLRRNGYPIAQPEVGDRVYMADERINFNEQVRIVQLRVMVDWKHNVRDISATFGTPGLSRRYQARLNSAIGMISDVMDGRKTLPISFLDERVKAISDIINGNTDSVFKYMPNGVVGWNGNNPNYMTRYVGDAIGFSKDGGATYTTAMSAELGVVAEMIAGRSIIGVNLTSADNTGFFHVTGPYAQFYDMLTRRTLDMSPTGIYGYAPNNPRPIFQADRTLVTSSAMGTSIDNVYLAAQAGFEARIVDMAGIPGDGNAASYSYLPLRAQGFYGNFIEPNGVTAGINFYVRPRAGGELRVTGSNTTDVYYPIRAANIFGTGFISTTVNAYVGADGELRVVNKGFVDSTGGTPIYRDVRGLGFIGNRVGLGTHVANAIHFHVQPALDGEVQITDRSGNGTFRPIRARDFITDTSDRENKTDIVEYSTDTLDIVRRANVYNYRRANDEPDAPMQLGLMIDEMPEVTHSETGDSFALYALAAYTFKAVKDTLAKVDQLEKRIEQLEGATT